MDRVDDEGKLNYYEAFMNLSLILTKLTHLHVYRCYAAGHRQWI